MQDKELIMFIHYDPCSDETAHSLKIASAMDGGYKLPEQDVPILNWGKSSDLSKYTNVLNRKIIKNKFLAFNIMKEAGINVPEYWRSINDIFSHKYPVLGRKEEHSCGTDIYLLKRARYNQSKYYVKFIPKVAEFRVHVIGSTSFISQKIPFYANSNPVCWNMNNGFMFRDINIYKSARLTHAIRDIAHKSVKALNYDFGAVDVIVDKYDEVYCLEVNSAPALAEHRIRKYIELIKFNFVR